MLNNNDIYLKQETYAISNINGKINKKFSGMQRIGNNVITYNRPINNILTSSSSIPRKLILSPKHAIKLNLKKYNQSKKSKKPKNPKMKKSNSKTSSRVKQTWKKTLKNMWKNIIKNKKK